MKRASDILEQICDAAAAACGVPLASITKRTNAQSYATARQIATSLAREHGLTFDAISLRLERDVHALTQGLNSLEIKRRRSSAINDAYFRARDNLTALREGRAIERASEPRAPAGGEISHRRETMAATDAAIVLPTRKLLRDDLELIWRGGVYSLRKKGAA